MPETLSLWDLQDMSFPLQVEEDDKLDRMHYEQSQVSRAEQRLSETTHAGSRRKQEKDLDRLQCDLQAATDSFNEAHYNTSRLMVVMDAYVQLYFERLLEEAIADAADNGYEYEPPASDLLAAKE